jgi:hypothetical protein
MGMVFAVPALLSHTGLVPDLVAPQWTPGPPPLGADGCPTSWPQMGWGIADHPGPLVPVDGAISVTLCELQAIPDTRMKAAPARKLTWQVADMVAVLNALPDRATMEKRIRDREAEAGRKPPSDMHLGETCSLVGYVTNQSLVVHYPDRTPVAVLLDQSCGTAHADGRTRFTDPWPVAAFQRLYRQQLAGTTSPSSIKTPACPSTLNPMEIAARNLDAEPRDDIRSNRAATDPFLPSPLVAVTVCSYAIDGSQLHRATQVSLRANVEPLRGLINTATTVQTVTDERGTTSVTNMADCAAAPTRLTSVWVADATGAVAELRILLEPCQAVTIAAKGWFAPEPQLLTSVAQILTTGS